MNWTVVLTCLWQVCVRQGLGNKIDASAIQTVRYRIQYALTSREYPMCQAWQGLVTNKKSRGNKRSRTRNNLGTPTTLQKNMVTGDKNSASNRKKKQPT